MKLAIKFKAKNRLLQPNETEPLLRELAFDKNEEGSGSYLIGGTISAYSNRLGRTVPVNIYDVEVLENKQERLRRLAMEREHEICFNLDWYTEDEWIRERDNLSRSEVYEQRLQRIESMSDGELYAEYGK